MLLALSVYAAARAAIEAGMAAVIPAVSANAISVRADLETRAFRI
jgi:hypothetical protein